MQLHSDSDIYKCRICSISISDQTSIDHMNYKHREVFCSLIGVELRLNSSINYFICKACDFKLKTCSDLAQELGNMQKAFNEYLGNFETIQNDEIIENDATEQIEEQNSVGDKSSSDVTKIVSKSSVTRKLVVMLDRLDDSTIERYKSKKIHCSSEQKNLKSTEIVKTQSVIRRLVVRLERIDESIIESYKNKTAKSRNEHKTMQMKTQENKSSKLPTIDSIKCHICGYKPNYKENLIRHIALKHTFEKSQCEICKKIFDNKTKMEIHSKRNHEVLPEYKCQFCEAKYNVYIIFHKHIKNHHPFHKFKIQCFCDICGEEFFSKTRLESHMKLDHLGPFKCFDAKCIKSFTTAATRKKHYLALHNSDHEHFERLSKCEGNLRPFKCLNGFCNKRFKGYDSMLLHFRMKGKNVVSTNFISKIKQFQ